jgi:predicted outer membrane repeat protein
MRCCVAALLLLLAPAASSQRLTAVHLADLPALILASPDPLHTYKCLVLTGRDDGAPDTLRVALGDPRCAIVAIKGGVTVFVNPALGSLPVRRSVSIVCEQLLAGLTTPGGSLVPIRLANASNATAADRLGAKMVAGCVLDGSLLSGQSVVSVKSVKSFNVTDVKFVNGNAVNGGALLLNATRLAVLDHCDFNNNAASANGGAVAAFNSALVIIGSVFSSNSASAGNGGAVFVTGGELAVELSLFGKNVAAVGGGIYVSTSNLQIHFSTFSNNTGAVAQFGVLSPSVRTLISFSVFTSNVATPSGGALLVLGSGRAGSLTLDVDHCHFISNSASGLGGAIATSNGVASNLTANEFKNNSDACPGSPGSSIYIDVNGACLDVVAVRSQLAPTCGVLTLQNQVRRTLPGDTTCSVLQPQLLGPYCCQSDPLLGKLLCNVAFLNASRGCAGVPQPGRRRLAAPLDAMH